LGALTESLPKPMLPIDGHPFLEYLVWQLGAYGIGRIVISTGYRAEVVRDYFGRGEKWGIAIDYAEEPTPLGTGGAVRLAAARFDDERFLLLNGDSACDVDCSALLGALSGDLLAAMTLTRVADGSRYGNVELTAGGRIARFGAGDRPGRPALVNAGVYALRRELVGLIPAAGPASLERDVLPAIGSRIGAVVSDGYFVDMGLPETYRQLTVDSSGLKRAVRRSDYFG
jgi:NDP-sugar pyrophosphorylase family protein